MLNESNLSANTQSLSPSATDLLRDRFGSLPIWVRAPKSGVEHYSGFSRAKLYELATKGRIKTVSIREPGQSRGTRLFNLSSILQFIDRVEKANGGEAL